MYNESRRNAAEEQVEYDGPTQTENRMKKKEFLGSQAQRNDFPVLTPGWRSMRAPILNYQLG